MENIRIDPDNKIHINGDLKTKFLSNSHAGKISVMVLEEVLEDKLNLKMVNKKQQPQKI